MSRRLISLRGVSPEEAHGLREALDASGVEYYELPPTAFGISAGSIWILHDDEFERASTVFDTFQATFVRNARKNHSPEPLLAFLRRNPLRAAAYTAAAIAVLLVMFWPVFQLWL